jgi:hypothetical protein
MNDIAPLVVTLNFPTFDLIDVVDDLTTAIKPKHNKLLLTIRLHTTQTTL